MMRKVFMIYLTACTLNGYTQLPLDSLTSKVYHWNNVKFEGKTHALTNLEVHTTTLDPGKAPHPAHTHDDQEELIIIKEGQLKITIAGNSKILGPGSIAFVMPKDLHGIENAGNKQASYYILKYKGKIPPKESASSFTIDWNELKTSNTGKGYRRDFFNKATSQLTQFEMHTTALNADSVSHAPHTHVQEEIILILRGDVEMYIDGKYYKGSAGDLYFVSSRVPHALKNIGKEQCEYFAFQWRN